MMADIYLGDIKPNSKIESPKFPAVPESNTSPNFVCRHCNTIFYSLVDITLHMNPVGNSNLGTDVAVNECPICRLNFTSFKGMRQHFGKMHDRSKNIKCQHCDKTFKHRFAAKFHDRQVHQKITKVKCENCGKFCYNKYSHAEHFKRCQIREVV